MTLRRVMVSAETAGAGSWSVTVRLSDGQLLPARSMSGVDGLPQPRPGSALATDAGDVTAVRTVYDRLLARDPWGDDVADFGAYLFDVLLRDDWDEVVHACGSDGIELALRWDAGEQGLSRLPWELMHGPSGFLVADPDRSIGITRLVRGADAAFDDLPGELRVLFVIGTDRREPSIRPGAEYHMLLRRLNARGISFTSHVLARANRQSLTDELERWRPPVVHFICHGRFMDSQAALELTAEDDPRGRELLDGRQLADIMRAPGRPLPQIVVLNACQSGVSVGQEAAPLAAQLVAEGVPMVVGMSGQVADRACRLFTRRFYEALLQDESVVAATAEGRRAGHVGADPRRTVDWAFPTLFLSEEASPDVKLEPAGRDRVARLHRFADSYRTVRNPKVFCDRFEFVEDAYHRLMRTDVPGTRVLGVRVAHSDARVGNARYGKTRLLQELSAQAAAEGHVPCLVTFSAGEDTPTTLPRLGVAVLKAMIETRARLSDAGFQVSRTPPSQIFEVLEAYVGPIPELPQVSNAESAYWGRLTRLGALCAQPSNAMSVPRRVLAPALSEDLMALGRDAREHLSAASVLVLIDELHTFDAAAVDLVELLGQSGLGQPEDPVPVVFAFSTPQDARYSTAIAALRDFLESGRPYIERIDLERFASPLDDPVPYQQFLLHGCERPLVVSRLVDEAQVRGFYETLDEYVRGIPSQLYGPAAEVEALVRVGRNVRWLEEADDEAVLAQLRQ